MFDKPTRRAAASGGVGPLLRDWRARRRCSQMDLALDVVPLRERNRMLLAAGYAPRYGERRLDDTGFHQVRDALERLLRAHDPYPGLVLDRQWNVVLANRSAAALTALLPAFLTQPALNVFRASLHPQGLAAHTVNFEDWADYLLRSLRRAVVLAGDGALPELEREVLGYPNVQALAKRRAGEGPASDDFLVPCILELPFGRLSMFTTLTTFGTPRDITLDELCIELFYASDDSTARLLRARHGDAAL